MEENMYNNISDAVMKCSHNTILAAKYFGGMLVTLTNKTAHFTQKNLGINNENISRIAREIYERGDRLQKLIHSNASLYLKVSVADALLKDMMTCLTDNRQGNFKFKKPVFLVGETLDSKWMLQSEQNVGGLVSPDLLYEVLWMILKENEKLQKLTEEDKKIKSWNTRVDELQLIRKLGSPGNWNINTDSQDIEDSKEVDCCLIPVPEEMDRTRTTTTKQELAEPLYASNYDIVEAYAGIVNNDNTNVIEQKKKNHFFRPLTKLFKSGRNQKDKEINPKTKEKLNNSNFKQVKNLLEEKNTRVLDAAARKFPDSVMTGIPKKVDKDAESLTIQIPNNITRIVLMKDGHKVALEI